MGLFSSKPNSNNISFTSPTPTGSFYTSYGLPTSQSTTSSYRSSNGLNSYSSVRSPNNSTTPSRNYNSSTNAIRKTDNSASAIGNRNNPTGLNGNPYNPAFNRIGLNKQPHYSANTNRRANTNPRFPGNDSFSSKNNEDSQKRNNSRHSNKLNSWQNGKNQSDYPKKNQFPQSVICLINHIYGLDPNAQLYKPFQFCKSLRTRIDELPNNSREYKNILKYFNNGQGPTHTKNFRITIQNIFTASRYGELKEYRDNKILGNRKLLWHGSPLKNYQSILMNGLKKEPPSGVSINGKMFGNGIYFADVVTKAAQYCKPDSSNPYGILILAQVALGKHYYRTKSHQIDELPAGRYSVKGLGKWKPKKEDTIRGKYGVQIPLGELEYQHDLDTDLLYSEYIVYDNNQILVEYLVLIKFDL